jgi:hypothetical protein
MVIFFSPMLQGRRKRGESFWGACKAIFNIICGDFGIVRVDFAQPFSVQVSTIMFTACSLTHMFHFVFILIAYNVHHNLVRFDGFFSTCCCGILQAFD